MATKITIETTDEEDAALALQGDGQFTWEQVFRGQIDNYLSIAPATKRQKREEIVKQLDPAGVAAVLAKEAEVDVVAASELAKKKVDDGGKVQPADVAVG